MFKSQQLQNYLTKEFNLAQKLASTIGLTDNPPYIPNKSFYIQNYPHHPQHFRSKFTQINVAKRTLSAKKVKDKHQSLIQYRPKSTSSRKGSIKNILLSPQRPQNNPLILVKTQKEIIKNQYDRQQKILFESKIIEKTIQNKRKRSLLLTSMSKQISKQISDCKQKSFQKPSKSLKIKRKNIKQQPKNEKNPFFKNLQSNKFNFIVTGNKALQFLPSDKKQKKSQTKRNSRKYKITFNNGKVTLIYPEQQSFQF